MRLSRLLAFLMAMTLVACQTLPVLVTPTSTSNKPSDTQSSPTHFTPPTPIPPTQPAPKLPPATKLPAPLDDERVLARAILPFADIAFCNWQILGKNTQEVYAWVFCQMMDFPNSATSTPVVIKIDAAGHYSQVVYFEAEELTLELLPAAVRKRVIEGDVELDALTKRMAERLVDPSLPPLIITTGALDVPPNPPLPTHTPAPTQAVFPTLTQPTVPANPTLSLGLNQHWGEGPVDGAVWSPDGKQIAMLRSTGVSLHSAVTLKETQFFPTSSRVTALAYRRDGKRLVVGLADGAVVIWDPAAGQIVRTLTGDGPVQYLAFSPDGEKLLEAYVKEATAVNLWDVDSGSLLHTLPAFPNIFMSVFFTAEGEAMAWVYSGPSQPEWDVEQGKIIRILAVDWPAEAIHNQDGSLFATVTNGGLIQIWQPEGTSFTLLKAYQGVGTVTRLAFDPASDRLTFVNAHGEVWQWEWQVDKPAFAFALSDPATYGNNTVSDLVFSQDGRLLLTVLAGQVQTWDVQSGKALAAFEEPALASAGWFLNDGRLIMRTSDRQATRLLDLKNNVEIQAVLASAAVPTPFLAISPDGAWTVTSDGSTVVDIFPTGTQQSVVHIQPAPGWMQGAIFSPNSQQVLLYFPWPNPQSLVQLWNVNTGQMSYSHRANMRAVTIDPTGKWFALGGDDRYVTIYALDSGKLLQTLQGPADMVTTLAAGENKASHQLAAGSQDGTICIWDTQTWELLRILGPKIYAPNGSPMSAPVTALAFSPNAGLLVSASAGGWLRFWNPATGELLAEQRAHADNVTSLSFRQDGTQIVTVSQDGTLRLWDIK